MTETPPPDFATAADVVGRWRPLTPAENTKAELNIGDAAAIVRSVVKDIDARIAADNAAATAANGGTPTIGPLARATMRVVVDAVIRFLQNPNGAKRVQETIGDRAYTLDFGEVTGMFISVDEIAPLLPSAGGGVGEKIGTAFAATRPGWAPTTPGWSTHSADWWPNDG